MNDEKLASEISDLARSVHELVGEFKHFRAENAELKAENKELRGRVVEVEKKMPLLEEMRENSNKIRNSVVASLAIAVIIGGILAKFAGS